MIKTVWCITFYVSNLEKAAKFYEETLGLEKKYEYSSYVGFECGGVEIGLIPKLKEGQKVSPLSASVEFLVDDVEKVYKELKNKGVKFIKELHEQPWGGKQATFTDPDGNILEIAQINWKKYFAVSAEGAKKKE
jgi:catechol 2,3-dioxygenase-like lactoylglutathione lyase family enzyme